MEGIVIQLQKDALDDSIDIETLLRKAFLVARKLNLEDFKKWILEEQNGYKSKVPDYRMIQGKIYGWNPYHGWIPMILPAKVADIASRMPIPNSISSLLDVYNSSEDRVAFSVNGAMTEFFNNSTDFMPTKYAFFVSKSELYRIMSTVRNKILDWALLLEENGIVGNEMTFTDVEKQIAIDTPIINNYINNFYSKVSDVDMKQG